MQPEAPGSLPPSSAAAAAAASGPRAGKELTEAVLERARNGETDYVEVTSHDFQGQEFQKCKPTLKLVGRDNPQFTAEDERWAPPLRCKAVNHIALGAHDVDALCRFYTKVLGFRQIARPDLGFPGYWLKGLGVMIHIIQTDPTVPHRLGNDWKEQYTRPPEAWFIRRGSHIALEVEDFEEAERCLRRHGVEYARFVLPEADMRQLFFYDVEGNGVEVGSYQDTWRFLREHGEDSGWLGH